MFQSKCISTALVFSHLRNTGLQISVVYVIKLN